MESKEKKTNVINSFNIVFVDIQIVLTVLTVILSIVVLFHRDMMKLFQLSLGCCLLMMAYNNQKIYKRKNITIVYVMVGIILLVCLGV